MKKRIILVCLIIVFAVIIIAVLCNQIGDTTVGTFELNEYQDYIDDFSSNEVLGSIIDSRDAIKKAESLWIDIYGRDVKSNKPYQVFYDSKSETWLVCGSLKPGRLGGVPYALIENKTGKVLAVWHDK